MRVKIFIVFLGILFGILLVSAGSLGCSGCFNNSNCYGVGEEVNLSSVLYYCDFDGNLSLQKSEGENCTNNFECLGLPCLSGKCTDIYGELEDLERDIIANVTGGVPPEMGANDPDDDPDDPPSQDPPGSSPSGGISYNMEYINGTVFGLGYRTWLYEDDRIKFPFNNRFYYLEVVDIGSSKVKIELRNNIFEYSFNSGENKRFDINNDGDDDLYVKINSFTSSKVDITIKKVTGGGSSGGSEDPIDLGGVVDGTDDIPDEGVEKYTRWKNWFILVVILCMIVVLFLIFFFSQKLFKLKRDMVAKNNTKALAASAETKNKSLKGGQFQNSNNYKRV